MHKLDSVRLLRDKCSRTVTHRVCPSSYASRRRVSEYLRAAVKLFRYLDILPIIIYVVSINLSTEKFILMLDMYPTTSIFFFFPFHLRVIR